MVTKKKTAKPKTAKKRSPEWDAAKAEQHRLKRAAILHAAAASFTKRGYYGASLSNVAEQLNMTNGALYYYFKNKEELAFECLMATQEQSQKCLELAENEESLGLKKVEAFVRNIIVANETTPTWVHPGEPFFLKAQSRKMIRAAAKENHAKLAGLIESGVKDRSIGFCEPNTTALLIMGSLVFLHNWVPNIGGFSPEKISELAASFVSKSLKPAFKTS
jgi:AcrR family transcriptional regulator